VSEQREPACPRCGCTTYDRVSDRESRCHDCGLGRTSTALVVRASGPRSEAEQAQVDRFLRQHADPHAAFDDATFAPFALDERWGGTRWFGGSGYTGDQISHLSLAHGEAPWDDDSPQIRVDTHIPQPFRDDREESIRGELATIARHQVNDLWMKTGTMTPEVRAAAFPVATPPGEPTAPWEKIVLAVDETPIQFNTLGHDTYWVAHARYDDLIIAISASHWPATSTGLVTVDDLAPYAEGSEIIHARGREHHS
jgi:hypothetical protein